MDGSDHHILDRADQHMPSSNECRVQDPSVSIVEMQYGILFYLKVLYDPNTHIEAEFPIQVKFAAADIYIDLFQ